MKHPLLPPRLYEFYVLHNDFRISCTFFAHEPRRNKIYTQKTSALYSENEAKGQGFFHNCIKISAIYEGVRDRGGGDRRREFGERKSKIYIITQSTNFIKISKSSASI